jgi:hypothetical protein
VIQTRLLALDTPGRLRERFFRRQVCVQLAVAEARLTDVARRLPFVREVRQEGNSLIFDLTDPDRYRPELVRAIVEAGGEVAGVTETQYPLEDVYLRLIHEEHDVGA